MGKEKFISSNSISPTVWDREWDDFSSVIWNTIQKQRLFIEGYRIFKKYIPPTAQTLLEVGAGSGRYGLAFARNYPNITVTLTDVSPAAIALIQKLVEEIQLPNVVVLQADMLRLPFPDSHFDVVFCDAVIQHLYDPAPAMREIVRVLKPGGRLIISAVNTWNMPHTAYKWSLALLGRPYKYGYEKTYTRRELERFIKKYSMNSTAVDGFYPAYGIYRLKYIHSLFATIGKIVNRLTRLIDQVTNRWFSRQFGFEIFVVAIRPFPYDQNH